MNIMNIINRMNVKKFIGPSLFLGWILLGFYRGQNSYDYNFSYIETYLYSKRITHGICGMMMYACPIFIAITLPKELFRLEVNIRNLENEKTQDNYNNLF